MSEKEKEIIHREIDIKMQELEDTGLTRMEILFNDQRGIPLVDDPVFQYLKNNRVAREMIIKPGQAFTADAVIDKALRQDMPHTLNPNDKYYEQNQISKLESKVSIRVRISLASFFNDCYNRTNSWCMVQKTKTRSLENHQAIQLTTPQALTGE